MKNSRKDVKYFDIDAVKVRQNLEDAGCREEFIQAFFKEGAFQNQKEQIQQLNKYRKYLLEQILEYQRKIDCLDYLLYQFKENEIVRATCLKEKKEGNNFE